MDKELASKVAAILTIAATQNLQPEASVAQKSDILAETVVRTFESIYTRLINSKVLN